MKIIIIYTEYSKKNNIYLILDPKNNIIGHFNLNQFSLFISKFSRSFYFYNLFFKYLSLFGFFSNKKNKEFK